MKMPIYIIEEPTVREVPVTMMVLTLIANSLSVAVRLVVAVYVLRLLGVQI